MGWTGSWCAAQPLPSLHAMPSRCEPLSHLPALWCHCQEKEGDEGEAAAMQLVASLKQRGVLRAFDSARQVPKRTYTLEDLRLNKIEPAKFLSPTDTTLSTVRTALQVGGRGVAEICNDGVQHCVDHFPVPMTRLGAWQR